MNTEQRIARLESVLERVRRNAAAPRKATQVAEQEPQLDLAEVDEEDIEFDDEDVVDSEPLTSVAASSFNDAPEFLFEEPEREVQLSEEEAPRSSARSKSVASSMDEALADVDLPGKTPPPESGDQVASVHPAPLPRPVSASHAALQLDEAEDLELSGQSGAHVVAEGYAPTVELEEPFDGELELDDAPPPSIPDRSPLRPEELAEPEEHDLTPIPPRVSEVAVPPAVQASEPPDASIESVRGSESPTGKSFAAAEQASQPSAAVSTFSWVDADSDAAAAPGAQAAGAPRQAKSVTAARLELSADSVAPAGLAIRTQPALPAAEPQLIVRPKSDKGDPAIVFANATREFQPASFVELLDASLALGARDV